MRLSGLKVRKALELEISMEEIFQVNIESEGDIAAKEIYDDNITHSSEIENIEEIFGKNHTQVYSEKKEEIQINKNLKAYVFNFYMCNLLGKDCKSESKIESEKSLEVFFLNTKILNYSEFLENIMDAHKYVGKFPKSMFKRRFTGVGDFIMEDYIVNHYMISLSDLHFLDFFINDSNLVSTISSIVSANYEKDILEQKEYFNQEEYDSMLKTVKKHKHIISKGFDSGLIVD